MGGQLDPDLPVADQVQIGVVLFAFGKGTDVVEQPDAVTEGFQGPVPADAGAVMRQPPLWYCCQLGFSLGNR